MDQGQKKSKSGKQRYYVIAFLAFLVLPWCFRGDIPQRVVQTSLLDITTLNSVTERQFLYGVLDNFPHTFEFTLTESTEFSAEILSPERADNAYVLSAILIKESTARRGRVEEITRLEAKRASWESFWHFIAGRSLYRGEKFSSTLEPGTYRFEIHTPNNLEPYILAFGTQSHEWVALPQALKRIMDFNASFDSSVLRICFSLFGYTTLISLVGMVLTVRFWRKRRSVSMIE